MKSLFKPNPTLDQLCRFLNSVRGTDKVLMLIVYTSKIVIWAINRRHQISKSSSSADTIIIIQRIQNLIGPLSDTRMLLRYYGLIPMYQWILYSETRPAPTPYLRLLTRLQNLANVLYYPLEHAYWLGSHKVIPMSDETRDRLFGLWSSRFWALYVLLYFAQLWEEHAILLTKEVVLEKKWKGLGNTHNNNNNIIIGSSNGSSSSTSSLADNIIKSGGISSVKIVEMDAATRKQLTAQRTAVAEERKTWLINFIINAAYFPMTIHWSIENSPFPEIGVGVCGTVAALAQMYTAWIASS